MSDEISVVKKCSFSNQLSNSNISLVMSMVVWLLFTVISVFGFCLVSSVFKVFLFVNVQLDADHYAEEGLLAEIRQKRGYTYEDTITCTPEKLPNYNEKVST